MRILIFSVDKGYTGGQQVSLPPSVTGPPENPCDGTVTYAPEAGGSAAAVAAGTEGETSSSQPIANVPNALSGVYSGGRRCYRS